MAPMNMLNSKHSSSNYGEDIVRKANVLASCYVVDATASLKGLHYCTTGAAGTLSYSTLPLPLSLHTLTRPFFSYRGRVVFLRSPSQDYPPRRQVPPSRQSPRPTSSP